MLLAIVKYIRSSTYNRLGKMEGSYTVALQEGAQSYSVNVPRRVALPLMDRTKRELKRMEELGVITRVEQPADWCVPMVIVPKLEDAVRICRPHKAERKCPPRTT